MSEEEPFLLFIRRMYWMRNDSRSDGFPTIRESLFSSCLFFGRKGEATQREMCTCDDDETLVGPEADEKKFAFNIFFCERGCFWWQANPHDWSHSRSWNCANWSQFLNWHFLILQAANSTRHEIGNIPEETMGDVERSRERDEIALRDFTNA